MKRIILIGFMGAGKSTIAKELSRELLLPLIEMDSKIEEQAQMSISNIFAVSGEARFRELETSILIESMKKEGVIATGGGILSREENKEILKKEPFVFYLEASFDTLYKHIKNDNINQRPLAQGENIAYLENLLKERVASYKEVASKTISIDNLSIEEVVSKILMEVKEMTV